MNHQKILIPSRLKEKGIISRRAIQTALFENKTDAKRAFSPKTREPIVALSIQDLKNFFFVTQVSGLAMQSKVFGVVNTYFVRELKKNDNEELNDMIGCKLLSYLNDVYHFMPDDLPKKVVLEILKQRNSFKSDENVDLSNLNDTTKALFPTISQIGTLKDPLYKHQVRELWKASQFSAKEFVELYSFGEIPDGMEHTPMSSLNRILYGLDGEYFSKDQIWEKDKAFRFWLVFGLYYGFIEKQPIFDAIDKMNLEHFTDFEHLRSQIFSD